MATTTLHTITTDTPDRYEFTIELGALVVDVVVSTVFGDSFGATAVIATGEDYPAEDAYLYLGAVHPLQFEALGVDGEVRRHRILWALAADVERALGRVNDERLAALEARYADVPDAVVAEAEAAEAAIRYDGPTDQELAAEAELDVHAEVAFAEDLERRAAAGTWFGRAPEGADPADDQLWGGARDAATAGTGKLLTAERIATDPTGLAWLLVNEAVGQVITTAATARLAAAVAEGDDDTADALRMAIDRREAGDTDGWARWVHAALDYTRPDPHRSPLRAAPPA